MICAINYDLKKPGQNYDPLYTAIKSLGTCWHYLSSTWLVDTNLSANGIWQKLAPHVDKIRYNPGHLHHIERAKSIPEKVRWIVDVAREHDIAIRIGVNCGSVAPAFLEKHPGDQLAAIVESAVYHCELMEQFGFDRFVVSLKDSDPAKVLDANRRFGAAAGA